MSEAVLVSPSDASSLDVASVVESVKRQLTVLLQDADPDSAPPRIDEHASFDLLGLDSMSRVGLVAALEKEYGVALEPTAAYDFVTVGALSQFVWSRVTGTALDEKKLLGV